MVPVLYTDYCYPVIKMVHTMKKYIRFLIGICCMSIPSISLSAEDNNAHAKMII